MITKPYLGRSKKKNAKSEDESYIVSAISNETDDEKISLEDETIDLQLRAPIMELDEQEESQKMVQPPIKQKKRKKYKKRMNTDSNNNYIKKKRGRKPLKEKKMIDVKEKEKDNNFKELNENYNKLQDLLTFFSFEEIVDAYVKLNNNINEKKKSDRDEFLLNSLKQIKSVIHKKEDIIMMCLSILYSIIHPVEEKKEDIPHENIDENIKQDNNYDILIDDEKQEEEQKEPKIEKKENVINKKKISRKLVYGFDKFRKFYHKYGLHFYKVKNCVYVYDPRVGKKRNHLTVYCRKYNQGCRAKCAIVSNSNVVEMKGEHNHEGYSFDFFYDNYPELNNINWTHAQIIKEYGKDIIIKQN